MRRGWGGGLLLEVEEVGDSVGDQGSVYFCYLPPFTILTPRGKTKAAVSLNRYNSCRPKQCTGGWGGGREREGVESWRAREADERERRGRARKRGGSLSRQRLGQRSREAAVNCKCVCARTHRCCSPAASVCLGISAFLQILIDLMRSLAVYSHQPAWLLAELQTAAAVAAA